MSGEQGRARLVVANLGAKDTGKTTLSQRFAKAARERGQRVAVLSPEQYIEGCVWPFPENVEAWLAERLAAKDVDMLVLEDFDRYAPLVPGRDSPWNALYLTNRHVNDGRGIDLVLSGRRPQAVPHALRGALDWCYLFAIPRSDQNGRALAEEWACGHELPQEPHRFLVTAPQSLAGRAAYGRTLPDGSYVFE